MSTPGSSELSRRGQGMAAGGLPSYIKAHIERRHDPGYIGLSVAENLQHIDLLRPPLTSASPLPDDVMGYGEMAGRADLRGAIAQLFERELFGRPVDPACVQLLAGAGGVLDAIGHALGDPGDVVIVPTPSYAGFWPDLEIRPGLRIVTAPTSAADGYGLTTDVLDQALAAADGRARMLLLTNPDNPRGQIHPADDVDAALRWAAAHDLHVIADEIYGLSVFDGSFTSVGRLRPELGDRLHVVWGFSKDFGMSGLRAGVLITENEALRRTVDLQASWQGVSGHTQHLLAGMLQDSAWLSRYLSTMRTHLRALSDQVVAALERAGVPFVPPQAGFFLLCDLRGWLSEPTFEAEQELWQHLLDETGVNLTPGSALRSEPGWFRLCFAANPLDVVVEGITRVGAVLRTRG